MWWAPSSLNPRGLAPRGSQEGSIWTAVPPASTAQPHRHLGLQWGGVSVESALQRTLGILGETEIQGTIAASPTPKS